MRKLKQFFHLIPLLMGWAVLSVILWGWIFTLVTNIAPQKCIVIAIDAPVSDPVRIAADLEIGKPAMIERVRVLPFSYAVMSSAELEKADLFLINERDMTELQDWLIPIKQGMLTDLRHGAQNDEQIYGILIGKNEAYPYPDFVYYEKDENGEAMRYYLCLGKKGAHINADGMPDNALMQYLKVFSK